MTELTPPKTIFLTGASGFIAKHICLKALSDGHTVVGSVRSEARAEETRRAMAANLADATDLTDRLRFVTLDLTEDGGWDETMHGADTLIHTASPVPLEQPKDARVLVETAVGGTRRALKAASAAGIDRVVLTSSNAAIMNSKLPVGRTEYNESDWSDVDDPAMTPYAMSKTLAERAAWSFVEREAQGMALTTINPAFVLGPLLDDHLSASIKVVQRLLRAKDPALPDISFSCVDVRDIADMHVRALSCPETAGQRIVGADRPLSIVEMAKILAAAFPDRKIVTRQAPNWLVRIIALFDRPVRSIVPNLGRRDALSNRRAKEMLGMQFIDVAESLRRSATSLLERGIVD
ncbi:MAG: NAD-dependent epimerase/dehydratase family protein [Pseudomonadota bacterium]